MDENTYLAITICQLLDKNKSIVMASIISQSGSTPRHIGSKMLIDGQGKIYGTIGGSLLEATTINKAISIMSEGRSSLMNFKLDYQNVESKGMICGGNATVLLDYIDPSSENKVFFRQWRDSIVCDNHYFLTTFGRIEESSIMTKHTLLFPNGTIIGTAMPEATIDYIKREVTNISETKVLTFKDTRILIDPIHKTKTLYCMGAGHVAKPTAHLAAMVGFNVIVIDDRPEFANTDRFPETEVKVIEDFSRAFDTNVIDRDTFIVIFTRGHLYDRLVLEQALKTQAGYIGLMGSKKKRDTIYQALLDEGVSNQDIARVHCPIGIPMEAETPEELAISIVGELVNERVRQKW